MEIKIYLGQRRGYKGSFYQKEELIQLLKRFHREEKRLPTRITETYFIQENYEEKGFEIALLTNDEKTVTKLADFLLVLLDQKRVTILTKDKVIFRDR